MMFTGKDKKVRWGKVIAFIILGAIGVYLLLASLIRVPPHTVIAVKVPGGKISYANESDKTVIKWKWPYIYKVVGYREETIKLQELYEVKIGDVLEKIVDFYKLNPVELLKIADIVLEDEEKNKEFQELIEGGDYELAYKDFKTLEVSKESRIMVPAVKETTSSFALYTSYDVTGKAKDKTEVRAFWIDMIFRVKDWNKYLVEIDLDEINKVRRQAGPGYPLMKDRSEVIIEPIKNILRSGGSTDRFGWPIKTEEGYPAMDISTRIQFGFYQLAGRRNFLITLLDHYPNLDTEQKIMEYLKEEIPWYYFGGPSTFEQLAQRWKDTTEATLSSYMQGIAQESNNQRVIFSEDSIVLFQQALQAWHYEEFLMEKERKLEDIESRKELFKDPQLQKVSEGFEKFLKLQDRDLKFVDNEQNLQSIYNYFIGQMQQFYILFAFRRGEVDAINKNIAEAEKKFLEISEEDKRKAEEFVQGLLRALKDEAGREIWQLTDQGVGQIFDYYLAKNGLVLPEKTKQYFGLMVTKAYVEAQEAKVVEAEKFLDEVKIAKEFYLDLKAKLQGQKVDMNQLMKDYFSGKQLLFQQSFGLIMLNWQEEKLGFQERYWEEQIKETIKFFKKYSNLDTDLAFMTRRLIAEENDALWRAAIDQVLNGKRISHLRPFWIHEIQEGETLAQIVEKYKVDWQLAFHQLARFTIYQSLSLEKRTEFDHLFAKGIVSGDYEKAYEFAKNIPLREGKDLVVWKVDKFSDQWFEQMQEYRKKREQTIKQYIYPIIEKFVPQVVEEYLFSPNSPWINYIENTYGVEILQVKVRIEDDEMFDKAGTVKMEYWELYQRRAKEWELGGEEEKKEE